MMFKKLFMISALLSPIALSGCTEDIDGSTEQLSAEEETLEIVDNLVLAGYPESEIEVQDDGTVLVGGDAHVSLQASREMIGLHDDGSVEFRQYRTNNLVGANVKNICVNGKAYTGAMSAPLDAAIANYNNLNLSFHMTRTSGSTAGCDAVITGSVKGQAGGVSGFPTNGLPYSQFQVGKGTANYGAAVVTHVITHELGHCIGFRHTDFYNRSISCGGSATNEGDGGVGAQLIPGTPSTAVDNGSVMNSCFNLGSTGAWTSTDVTALNALY